MDVKHGLYMKGKKCVIQNEKCIIWKRSAKYYKRTEYKLDDDDDNNNSGYKCKINKRNSRKKSHHKIFEDTEGKWKEGILWLKNCTKLEQAVSFRMADVALKGSKHTFCHIKP